MTNKIVLPIPPSINATYKVGQGRFYKAAAAHAWEQEALWIIKSQWKKKPLTGKVSLTIKFFFKRARDISSGLKILEDVLQTAGVYENDSQIYHEDLSKTIGEDVARVEIQVEPLFEQEFPQ